MTAPFYNVYTYQSASIISKWRYYSEPACYCITKLLTNRIKHWLIIPSPQDPRRPYRTALDLVKYGISTSLCFFISISIFVSFNVQSAHAGFFSDITSFFTGWGNSTKVDAPNSQQMPILQAPINGGESQVLGTSTRSADAALLSSLYEQDIKASEPLTSSTTSTYTVISGDTLSEIAKKFNISLSSLLAANHLTTKSVIRIGQKLTVVMSTGNNINNNTIVSSNTVSIKPVSHSTTYIVRSGDTLFSISKKYNVSVTATKAANSLKKDTIFVGEKLSIPAPAIQVKGSVTHVSQATPLSVVPALATTVNSEIIMMPVSDHKVFSPDGYYMRPIVGGYRSQGIHSHNAVDLADSCGTPIYASASGKVVIAKGNGDWNGGYGNYVEIDHPNNTQTLYAHMQTVIVSVDQSVVQGQEIGTIGNTGDVIKEGGTGCHVHFEIHNNGYANPF